MNNEAFSQDLDTGTYTPQNQLEPGQRYKLSPTGADLQDLQSHTSSINTPAAR